MSQEPTIVSLPIINSNESKYDDCVNILRTYETYEKWIAEIYVQAGLLHEIPHTDNPPVPEGRPAPGQTNAHRQDTIDDPMREMTIPFAGDQRTRVRFAEAKELLLGSYTASDRFEHCSPFKPVMWHTKASLLQYTHSFLHKAESVNLGTLKYIREKCNMRNAAPSKVLDSYEGSEELFLSGGEAYIITAVLNLFGMSDLEDTSPLHQFPQNIARESAENKKKYFDDAFGKFIDTLLLQKVNATVSYTDDYVMNYALCCIFLAVLVMQMKDSAAEGDGTRNLINQKLLLSDFKSMGAYS